MSLQSGVVQIQQGQVSGGLISGTVQIVQGQVSGGLVSGTVEIIQGQISGGQVSGTVQIIQGQVSGGLVSGIVGINPSSITGGGGGTGGGAGGGGINAPCTQPTGSVNPVDWLAYWSCILAQGFKPLTDALSNLKFPSIDALWAAVPSWLTTWFTAWTTFWDATINFLKDPTSWFDAAVTGLTKETSESTISRLVDYVRQLYLRLAYGATLADKMLASDKLDPIQAVHDFGASIGTKISSPTDAATVEARVIDLDSLVSKLLLGLNTAQVVSEQIPLVNRTGTAAFTMSWLEARGIFSMVRGNVEPYLTHNILRELDYCLNERYHNVLSSLGELERLRNLGKIPQEIFTSQGMQVSGIASDRLEQMRVAHHQVPSLEDYFTYNFRHPTNEVQLEHVQDIVGVNWDEYGDILAERQYGDLTLRYVQNAANLLNFDETQVREILRLTRLDPRVNAVLGMSPLEVAVRVVLDRKKVYDASQAGESTKTKHFGYSLLIQMAEQGIDNSDIQDSDLKDEGWDDVHRGRLEDYIQAKVAAKLAKKTATTP